MSPRDRAARPRRTRQVERRPAGHPIRENLPVGIMAGVPAAALMADHPAKEVDFLPIGTNDLTQDEQAVDRPNETVVELDSAADPSARRWITKVVEAAAARGVAASVRGALGEEPLCTIPRQPPEIRRVIPPEARPTRSRPPRARPRPASPPRQWPPLAPDAGKVGRDPQSSERFSTCADPPSASLFVIVSRVPARRIARGLTCGT